MSPPQVTGTLSRNGRTITVRCPFCSRKHVHGAATFGLRVAHCQGGESRSYDLIPADS
jgi:hypothetical protein